jgi:FAD/FMN-containing dehydrogenase
MTMKTEHQQGTADAAALRGLAGGGVFLPGDDGYEQARVPWSLTVDLQPSAVAYPDNAAEVAALVRAAAAAGLRVAPLGTGHQAGALAGLSGAVLLRTPRMNGIEVDPATRRARAEAGAVWSDVADRAAVHRLAALHGSSPDAGVVGYSLGGGISWYGRSLGLACNSVSAVELVTADGQLVRADSGHERDLFWALRGGGAGNFGVVTALEFGLYPIETVYAGLLAWDWKHAHQVISRWVEWAGEAPDAVTTSCRLLRYPPIPDIPEPFRGRDLVMIDGAVLADDGPAERILASLRQLAPEIDTFARVPAVSLTRLHMDPESPVPSIGWGAGLSGLPPASVDELLEAAGPDSGTTLFLAAELRQLGGALGRPQAGGGALDHLSARFIAAGGGLATTPESRRQTLADIARLEAALAPFTGRPYLNMVDQHVEAATAYEPGTWQELLRIRQAVDPTRLFQASHEITG